MIPSKTLDMKKFILPVLIAGFILACNNEKKTESNESAPVTPGADNVNGNIPDTSDAVRLNQSMPKDSSHTRDSTH